MKDKDGNLCPDADDEITFDVTGGAVFRAVCNGDATSLESFTKPTMKLFHGQLVLTVEVVKPMEGFEVKAHAVKRGITGTAFADHVSKPM